MGTREGSRLGCGWVTAIWCRAPPTGIRRLAKPYLGQFRPPGQDDRAGRDRPRAGVHPGDLVAIAPQPEEADLLAHHDAGLGQGHRVGGHVAGRGDVAVVRAEGPAQGLARGQGGVALVHLVRAEPHHVQAQIQLHGHALPGRGDLSLGEARQQVSLGHEAGVDAEFAALAPVEVLGPLPQSHRLGGAALGPDHAGGPAARALAEHPLLQQDDPQAVLAQEVGAPRAHGPAAHDDDVGGVRMAAEGHWHEPDADIN